MSGVLSLAGAGIFLFALCADKLWGPRSLLSSKHWGLFLQNMKLTSLRLNIEPSSFLFASFKSTTVTVCDIVFSGD
jgi:hypothetical protein